MTPLIQCLSDHKILTEPDYIDPLTVIFLIFFKDLFLPQVKVSLSTQRFYTLLHYDPAALQDSNPGPLLQKSGDLRIGHPCLATRSHTPLSDLSHFCISCIFVI